MYQIWFKFKLYKNYLVFWHWLIFVIFFIISLWMMFWRDCERANSLVWYCSKTWIYSIGNESCWILDFKVFISFYKISFWFMKISIFYCENLITFCFLFEISAKSGFCKLKARINSLIKVIYWLKSSVLFL